MGIRFDGGSGGAPPVTRYQESFNRADQPFFLGDNWYMQVTDQTGTAPSSMAGSVNVGAGFATIGGAAQLTARSYFTPAFVDRQAITTGMLQRGQYSQFTVKNIVAGVSGDIGPMVYNPSPNNDNGYMMLLGTTTGIARLFRDMGAGATQLVANLFNYVNNDIVRLEVTPAAGANTIRSFQNGILRNTFVDNAGARPTTGGMYGIAWFSNGAAGALSFGDYDGGLL